MLAKGTEGEYNSGLTRVSCIPTWSQGNDLPMFTQLYSNLRRLDAPVQRQLSRIRRLHQRRLLIELMEDRRLLTGATYPWDTSVTFDQFTGGEAKVLAIGYNADGSENPELLGFDFCRATRCGSTPFNLGPGIGEGLLGDKYGANASLEISGRLGIEYGFYANAGSASLLYDGEFGYDVDESGSGPVNVSTSVDIANGSLLTQSPTVRTFVDLVAKIDGRVSGQGCFIGCTAEGSLDFHIDERVPLLSINRNADGEIKFIGSSLLEKIYDKLKDAREESKDGEKEKKEAEQDRRKARTPAEFEAARQKLEAAEQKIQSGKNKESNTNQQASNNAKGKKFGGGEIVQISVGEAPGDLLGVEFELGVGVGVKGNLDISKRLGSFSVTLPDIALSDSYLDDDDSLSASTELDDPKRNLANLTLDIGAIVGGGYGLGSTSIALGPLAIDLTTVSYDLSTTLRVNQDVRSDPRQMLQFDFSDPNTNAPKLVTATVNGVEQVGGASITFKPGDQVAITPSGDERVKVTTKLLPKYNFANDIGLDLEIEGILRALALQLTAFGETLIDVPPLISRSDTFGQFDFGDVFNKQFEVQADPITFDSFIIGGPKLDLGVTVSGGESIQTDTSGQFDIKVDNFGPNISTNAQVVTTLPAEFAFSAGDSSPACSAIGQTVTCNAGSIPQGGQTLFEIGFIPSVSLPKTFNLNFTIESDDRDTNALNDRVRVQSLVTRPQTFIVTFSSDRPGTKPGCPNAQTQTCTLREAIKEANDNPGPDTIYIATPFTQLLALGELVITDSVDIIGPRGGEIGFDEKISRFWSNPFGSNPASLLMTIPTRIAGRPPITAKDIVDAINAPPITQFDDTAKFTAELVEGDGSAEIEFHKASHAFLSVTSGGSASTLASGIFDPPGEGNAIRITAREAGTSLNDVTIELKILDETFYSARSRIFRIGGNGANQVRLVGMTLQGGNALSAPKEIKSIEFNQSNVQASRNRIETFNQDFRDNDSVLYSAVDGVTVGGLTDGETYTVVNAGGESGSTNNPPGFRLKDRFGNLVILSAPASPSRHRFNAQQLERLSDGHQVNMASVTANPSPLDPFFGSYSGAFIHGASNSFLNPGHGFQNGDVVRYKSPLPSSPTIEGLHDGQSYFVINATSDTFQLANSASGPIVDIDGEVTVSDFNNGLGGAILLDDPDDTLILDFVHINKNAANWGGGVYSKGGQVQINNSSVHENFAIEFGGGLFTENSSSSLTRTVFTENRAGLAGGAFYQFVEGIDSTGTSNIVESDFVNNRAPDGAAIRNTAFGTGIQATIHLEGSTFAQNHDAANFMSEGSFGGIASIVSDGRNLDDEANAFLNKLGDVDEIDLISLSNSSLPSNVPGATVGSLQFNVPSAVEPIQFLIDDDRFEVVAGALQLKSNQSLDVATSPSVAIHVSVVDGTRRQWSQPFTIDVVALPSAPLQFAAIITSPQSVRLQWKDSDSESTYEVLERDGAGLDTVIAILPPNSTSYAIEDLTIRSSHTYLVQASNVAGSRRSVTRSVNLPVPLPTIPLDLVADILGPTALHLSWQEATFADGYRVFVDGIKVADLAKTVFDFDLEQLAAGSSVKVTVEAFNSSGTTPSEELTVELPPSVPIAPTNFAIEKISNTSVRLRWADTDTESEYRVFRRQGNGAEAQIARLGSNTTSLEVTNLVNDALYTFFVRAINISGSTSTVGLQTILQTGPAVKTIFFAGSGIEVDLPSIGNNQYPQLQTVSIDGSGPNSITLKQTDILNLVQADDDLNLILGLDDKIVFNGQWLLTGGEKVGGKFYRVLKNGDAIVRLDRPDGWHNPIRDVDVTGDGKIFPLDALAVINELNAPKFSDPRTRILLDPMTVSNFNNFFMDVNGDGRIFPIDALLVINELNRNGIGGEGEASDEFVDFLADSTRIMGMSGIPIALRTPAGLESSSTVVAVCKANTFSRSERRTEFEVQPKFQNSNHMAWSTWDDHRNSITDMHRNWNQVRMIANKAKDGLSARWNGSGVTDILP